MSYIPRSSVSSSAMPGAIPKLVKKKYTFRVFGFIATVLLALSFFAVIAMFAWKQIEARTLTEVKQTLEETNKKSSDFTKNIESLDAFDKKLRMAESLLTNHLAPSKLLREIEETTKKTVQIMSFEYSYDPGFQVLVELQGGTDSLMSVALQDIEYVGQKAFTEYVLEDISASTPEEDEEVDPEEKELPVAFSISGEVDKKILAYTGEVARVETLEKLLSTPTSTSSVKTATTTPSVSSSTPPRP